jgi:ribosomal protein L24
MNLNAGENLKDGDKCKVVGGTHIGKSGIVRDINTSKTSILQLQLNKTTVLSLKRLEKM